VELRHSLEEHQQDKVQSHLDSLQVHQVVVVGSHLAVAVDIRLLVEVDSHLAVAVDSHLVAVADSRLVAAVDNHLVVVVDSRRVAVVGNPALTVVDKQDNPVAHLGLDMEGSLLELADMVPLDNHLALELPVLADMLNQLDNQDQQDIQDSLPEQVGSHPVVDSLLQGVHMDSDSSFFRKYPGICTQNVNY